MTEMRYTVQRAVLGGFTSTAWIDDNEEPADALRADVLDSLATDIMVTIGGVTMHLAAWVDPDHWAEDWREAGADPEALMAAAMRAGAD